MRKNAILIFLFLSIKALGQTSGDITVNALIEMGFENVSWIEDEQERVFVVENTPYRLSGVGVGKVVDQIQETGLPLQKSCRLIILENNIPQISLYYKPVEGDTIPDAQRHEWDVSYNLGDSWDKIKHTKQLNRSLFKVDITVYTELSMSNLILEQIYQTVFSLSPAVEVSFWKGMKLTAQLIVPIYDNDKYQVYSDDMKQVRQGYMAISQDFRLPHNVFITANAGVFNNRRWGVDLQLKHVLEKDQRFSFFGAMGYTGASRIDNFKWYVSPLKRFTWNIGAAFFWPKYNVQAKLRVEQHLAGDKGVRFDFMRKFRYAAIGFYAMKTQYAPRNGGFYFQIALPPYGKYKRKQVRVTPAKYFGMVYNAGNERYYGLSYTPQLSRTLAYELDYNPYFIKSELLNY